MFNFYFALIRMEKPFALKIRPKSNLNFNNEGNPVNKNGNPLNKNGNPILNETLRDENIENIWPVNIGAVMKKTPQGNNKGNGGNLSVFNKPVETPPVKAKVKTNGGMRSMRSMRTKRNKCTKRNTRKRITRR